MRLTAKFSIITALILCMSACGVTGNPQPLTINEAASTLVALTFQAATQSASLVTPTAPPPATPIHARPMLYINVNTNCRTGTSPNFKPVQALNAGDTVEMIGKDPSQTAWLVKVPNSSNTCWVLAGDGSPSGDYASLPAVTPQPSLQKPPAMPGSISWPYYCTYSYGVIYKVTVDLSWIDPAGDANGYRVYRQTTLITDVPSTTTSVTDTANVTFGADLSYSVEAYNDAGVSAPHTITIHSICK